MLGAMPTTPPLLKPGFPTMPLNGPKVKRSGDRSTTGGPAGRMLPAVCIAIPSRALGPPFAWPWRVANTVGQQLSFFPTHLPHVSLVFQWLVIAKEPRRGRRAPSSPLAAPSKTSQLRAGARIEYDAASAVAPVWHPSRRLAQKAMERISREIPRKTLAASPFQFPRPASGFHFQKDKQMRYLIAFCLAAWIFAEGSCGKAAERPPQWPEVELAQAKVATMSGPVGVALVRGLARLAEPPYTAEWLLADVSRKKFRVFANYSGDVSGRFLELATLTSTPENPRPATLAEALKTVAAYQRPDGHFGADFDLNKNINVKDAVWKWAPIPMLWGNSRLLVGLVTAAKQFNEPRLLGVGEKTGGFLRQTAPSSFARSGDWTNIAPAEPTPPATSAAIFRRSKG